MTDDIGVIARDTITLLNYEENDRGDYRATEINFQGYANGVNDANDALSGLGTTTFSGSGLNDLTFGGFYDTTTANTFYVKIVGDAENPEQFVWSKNNFVGDTSGTISITGSAQDLANGITVTFGATTGHTNTDSWSMPVVVSLADAHTMARISASHEGSGADEKGHIKFKTNDGNDAQNPASTVCTMHANGDATYHNKCYNSDGARGLLTVRDVSGTIVNT
jgi:hypothetical protein